MKTGATSGAEPLLKWERVGLWSLLLLTLVFGGIVEVRSAFLHGRMTDADDYFRAAWAIRTGGDIYAVTDTNGWHYNYPPLFAILLGPLANPPPGADRTGLLPYPLSVALWYGVSVAFLATALHVLATALERPAPPPRCSRRWWALRVWPFLVCVMSVGRTLSRGQSNMLVLLFFCGMIALLLRGRRARAGLCLAGAICIKVYPAFLLLYPLWRRDFRFLAGCGAGLLLGLIVVPMLALGPARTLDGLRRYAQVTLLPGLGLGTDQSRADELTTATSTDSQAFSVVLHNCLHPDPASRPPDASPAERGIHWMLAAVLTALTFWSGRRARGDALAEVLFLGALIVIMLPVSPVCHLHYFVFAIPLVMALVAGEWERHGAMRLGAGCAALFALNILLNLLTSLPVLSAFKQFGVALFPTLALWAAGLVALTRRAHVREAAPNPAS